MSLCGFWLFLKTGKLTMNKQEHLNYLEWLLQQGDTYGGFGLSLPKCEGAFFWGEPMDFNEYVGRYKSECKSRGWLVDDN